MMKLPADIARCTGELGGAACQRRHACARWLAGRAGHESKELARRTAWTTPPALWPDCDLHMEARDGWRHWRLSEGDRMEIAHDFDRPKTVRDFEREWCDSCPHRFDDELGLAGPMCSEGCASLDGGGSDWLLEHVHDGKVAGRYCLRHPDPPRFREPDCPDLFARQEDDQ